MTPPPEDGHSHRNRLILIGVAGLLVISALAVGGALAFGGASHKNNGLVATNSGTTLPPLTTAPSDTVPTTLPPDTQVTDSVPTTSGSSGTLVTPTSVVSVGSAGWTYPKMIDQDGSSGSNGTLQALACVSGYTCFAGDDSGNVISSTGRGAWSLDNTSPNSSSVSSISCPSATFCAAIASDDSVMFWDGSNWSDPVSIDDQGNLQGVMCPNTSYCVAVDDSGFAFTYTGNATKWASTDATGSDGDGLTGVTCPSTTFCVAAPESTSGSVYAFNGSKWTEVSVNTSSTSSTIDYVSCSSTNFCEAIDDSGLAYTYSGGSWSTASDSPVTSATVEGLSCPVDGFCVAVNDSGGAIVYSSGAWSQPVQIDGNNSFVAVSCSGVNVCTAADKQDNILYYSGR